MPYKVNDVREVASDQALDFVREVGSGAPDANEAAAVTASPSRRQVLRGVAATGALAATGLLAACGGDDDSTAGGTGSTPATSAGTAGSEPTATETESRAEGQALAKTSDIPVGGGQIFDAEKVVVTQPTRGDFKGFSAVCTHQACLVSSVDDGIINCACHGSRYSITDGSVQGGPAPQPLPAKTISVEGDEILLA